jgi:hypothetical protein
VISVNVIPITVFTRHSPEPGPGYPLPRAIPALAAKIDKFVLMKRDFERKPGRQEYGKAYL